MKKKIRTAPQFLEHYLDPRISDYLPDTRVQAILKAMRAYASYQVDRQYEKLRQEVVENVEFQYGENNELKEYIENRIKVMSELKKLESDNEHVYDILMRELKLILFKSKLTK